MSKRLKIEVLHIAQFNNQSVFQYFGLGSVCGTSNLNVGVMSMVLLYGVVWHFLMWVLCCGVVWCAGAVAQCYAGL